MNKEIPKDGDLVWFIFAYIFGCRRFTVQNPIALRLTFIDRNAYFPIGVSFINNVHVAFVEMDLAPWAEVNTRACLNRLKFFGEHFKTAIVKNDKELTFVSRDTDRLPVESLDGVAGLL